MTTKRIKFGFNTLKLPYEDTQWVDADQRIFDACFTILGQYVEGELGRFEDVNSEDQYLGYMLHSSSGTDEKAIELWIWYNEYLEKIIKDSDKDYSMSYISVPENNASGPKNIFAGMLNVDGFNKKYQYQEISDLMGEKLSELMEIRTGLWT